MIRSGNSTPPASRKLRPWWVVYGPSWLVILAGWFVGAILVGYFNHENYWEKTIHRVQTVDFNMLHHSLPVKLSYLLHEGNLDEIQATVDSNYGLFGLVVTDAHQDRAAPSTERILCYSMGRSDTSPSWSDQLAQGDLQRSPFDELRWPPPLRTSWSYDSSRAERPHSTGLENDGEVIGRVYYLRGIPPGFEIGGFWRKVFDFASDSDTTVMHRQSTALLFFLCISIGVVLSFRLRSQRAARKRSERVHLRREREMEKQLLLFRTLHGDLRRGADASRQELQSMALDADALIREILRDERHDLKNDLQALGVGRGRALVEEVYRQAVQPAVDRILQMVDHLPEEISLEISSHSLNEIATAIEEGLPENILHASYYNFCFQTEFDGEQGERCRVKVNLHRLLNILKNLIRNSGAAISRHRSVLRADDSRNLRDYRGEVVVALRAKTSSDGEVLEMEIHDNAGGFPEEIVGAIYQEPVRSSDPTRDRKGEGTLCVGEFTRLMGGTVRAWNRRIDADLSGAVTLLQFPLACHEGSVSK